MPNPNKAPYPDALASMVDAIKVFYADHPQEFDAKDKKLIDSLATRTRIVEDMSDADRDVMYRGVKHLWVKMTGGNPEFESGGGDAKHLNGAYWMLPGGALLAGFNHFQAAKENKFLICSMLDINPIVFEKLLSAGDPHEVIGLVLARGGVRTLIDRANHKVVMQTNEESFPWVKGKLEKMYHKNKFIKIVDLSKPYVGWESGVLMQVN